MNTTTSGAASATCRQPIFLEGWPGVASRLAPPPISTMPGTQWPATNGGSLHSRHSVPIVGSGSARRRTRSTRARRPAASPAARSSVPVARPTVAMHSITSSTVLGSSETTVASLPRSFKASSTCPDGTAHTLHRSWTRIRSGWILRIRSLSSA